MNKEKQAVISASFLLFISAYLLYLRTLSPSVYFGDSGELIAMVKSMGVPHPTGFPLYILLGKLFDFLPLANHGFRINLLSAFPAALIPAALFLCFYTVAGTRIEKRAALALSLLPAAIMIFSYTLWSQAVISRIYTLNGLFCVSNLLLFLLYFEREKSASILNLMGFLSGIGAGLHLTFLMFSAILWLFIIIDDYKHIWKKLIVPALLFISGACVYLFIIIRGYSDAELNWHKFNSAKDIIAYLTQKQYSHKMFSREASGYAAFFNFIKEVLLREFSPVGFAAIIAGIILAAINRFKHTIALALIFVSNIILLSVYGNFTDLQLAYRYLIPSYIAGCFFIFLLFYYIHEMFSSKKAALILSSAGFILISALMFPVSFRDNDRSLNYLAYDFPKDLLETAGPGSYLFSAGDNQIYTLAYMQFAEDRYTDVMIFDKVDTVYKTVQLLQSPGPKETDRVMTKIYAALSKGYEPLFLTTPTRSRAFVEQPYGLLYKIIDKKYASSDPVLWPWKTYSMRNVLRKNTHYDFVAREVAGTYLLSFGKYYGELGNTQMQQYLLDRSVKTAFDSVTVLGNAGVEYSSMKDYAKAENTLLKAIKVNPKHPNLLFNLGSMYAQQGIFDKAVEYFQKTVELDPVNFNAHQYLNRAKEEIKMRQMKAAEIAKTSAHYNLGMALMQEKKFEEAIAEFKKDIKQHPNVNRSYFHIGLINSINRNFEEAVKWYEKALEVAPNNPSTLNDLALTLVYLNKKGRAIKLMEKSLRIKPHQQRIKKMLSDLKASLKQ